MNTIIDFRDMLPNGRHTVFMTIFAGLKDGNSFEFINDHEPKGLLRELAGMRVENLKWETIEAGPKAWRIRVSKESEEGGQKTKKDSCCGVCGGE